MYFECVHCPKIGSLCDGPNFLAMPSNDLLEWCKQRKALLKWSNAKLAEEANMPKGTVDRLLASAPVDFKFETIRPILKALVGGSWGSNPCGVTDDPLDSSMMEKAAQLEEENKILKEQLRSESDTHIQDVNNVKQEDRLKIDFLLEQLSYERANSKGRKRAIIALSVLVFVLFAMIIAALVVDHMNPNMGFFWSH